MTSRLLALVRDCAGVAAVELALVAPVIGAMTLVSFDVWQGAAATQDMRAALNAGVEYYLNGGTSDTGAQSAAMSAWQNAPGNAAISTVRGCQCGASTHSCSSLCSDGAPPWTVVTLSATATRSQALFNASLADQRVVRVR
jgi:Flp pilus assembly protein TadG